MKHARVLLLHSGALGDFVLTLGIVQALRDAGHTPITLLGRSYYSRIAGPPEGIDTMLDMDVGPWHHLFGDEPDAAVAEIAAMGPPPLVIDALGMSGAAAHALFDVGVESIIRLDPRANPGSRVHITEQWAASLRNQGMSVKIAVPVIQHPTTNAGRECLKRLGIEPEAKSQLAVIHVGSGGLRKCWQIENFTAVAESLQSRSIRIVFPIGVVELDRAAEDEWRDRLGRHGGVICDPTLGDLKALLAVCDVYVGNDSGVTHLAAALGRRTIAVFGATDPSVWRPLGENVSAVGDRAVWPDVDAVVGLLDEKARRV